MPDFGVTEVASSLSVPEVAATEMARTITMLLSEFV